MAGIKKATADWLWLYGFLSPLIGLNTSYKVRISIGAQPRERRRRSLNRASVVDGICVCMN